MLLFSSLVQVYVAATANGKCRHVNYEEPQHQEETHCKCYLRGTPCQGLQSDAVEEHRRCCQREQVTSVRLTLPHNCPQYWVKWTVCCLSRCCKGCQACSNLQRLQNRTSTTAKLDFHNRKTGIQRPQKQRIQRPQNQRTKSRGAQCLRRKPWR